MPFWRQRKGYVCESEEEEAFGGSLGKMALSVVAMEEEETQMKEATEINKGRNIFSPYGSPGRSSLTTAVFNMLDARSVNSTKLYKSQCLKWTHNSKVWFNSRVYIV